MTLPCLLLFALCFLVVSVLGDEASCNEGLRLGTVSFEERCLVRFYDQDNCDIDSAVDKPLLAVVTGFPDKCVEYRSTCYDIESDNDQIEALGKLNVEFPADVKMFSLDCTGDYEIMKGELEGFAVFIILLTAVSCCVGMCYGPYIVWKTQSERELFHTGGEAELRVRHLT